MRITVLGASGMAGTAVVNEALSRGHEVMAVSRQRGHRAGARLTSCLLDVTTSRAWPVSCATVTWPSSHSVHPQAKRVIWPG